MALQHITIAALALSCACAIASDPVLPTDGGDVAGVDEQGVVVFRGIPYAAPPVGVLRFAPPAAPPVWDGELDARHVGPACPQEAVRGGALALFLDETLTTDEDCLRLHVWAPASGGPYPVMVWLHGGANAIGHAGSPIYDGRRLAERGVVVVSLNYRLDVLGFVNHPALVDPATGHRGNFGLLDQIAALEWVQANIESFGGDPSSVTLFGESAGGWDTSALMIAPLARGLFHRAIVQSGPPLLRSAARAAADAEAFFDRVGCPGGDLACLRALPVDALIASPTIDALFADRGELGVSNLETLPARDETVLPLSVLEAAAAGETREVDLVIGTNADELDGVAGNLALLANRSIVEGLLADWLVPGAMADGRSRATVVYDEYERALAARGETPTPSAIWGNAVTDHTFRVFSLAFADAHVAAGGSARAYLFRQPVGPLGDSAHGSELPFVFGNLAASALGDLETAATRALSDEMMDAWVDIARGEAPRDWPLYDPVDRATRIWRAEPSVESDPESRERQVWSTVDARAYGF